MKTHRGHASHPLHQRQPEHAVDLAIVRRHGNERFGRSLVVLPLLPFDFLAGPDRVLAAQFSLGIDQTSISLRTHRSTNAVDGGVWSGRVVVHRHTCRCPRTDGPSYEPEWSYCVDAHLDGLPSTTSYVHLVGLPDVRPVRTSNVSDTDVRTQTWSRIDLDASNAVAGGVWSRRLLCLVLLPHNNSALTSISGETHQHHTTIKSTKCATRSCNCRRIFSRSTGRGLTPQQNRFYAIMQYFTIQYLRCTYYSMHDVRPQPYLFVFPRPPRVVSQLDPRCPPTPEGSFLTFSLSPDLHGFLNWMACIT